MVCALGELRIHDVGSAIEKGSRKTSQGPCSASYAPHSLEEAEQGQLPAGSGVLFLFIHIVVSGEVDVLGID